MTTRNVGMVIDAMFVEIAQLFDNPHKAADALKLLKDLAKEEHGATVTPSA